MRIALVAAVLLVPWTSAAGELSTLHALDVRDASHRVKVTVDGRVARFRISHTLVSRDRRSDEVFLGVDLPAEGAAVGLRVRTGGRWIDGGLLAAERADERYQLLTTSGRPAAGGGAALLFWEGDGQVTLTAFPIARQRPADLEISSLAPLCYHAGLAVTYYPMPDAEAIAAPAVAVGGGRGHWLVRPGRRPPAAIAPRWAALAEACPGLASDMALVFEREPRAPVAAAAASLDLASGRRVVWLEVDTARELAPLPRGARVLFVLDGSRSIGADGMARQLDLVRGYLAELPDAAFEIVVYRRRASRLLGRFAPARQAVEALARVPARALAPENGSHLDDGLALAGQLARGARGPVRIIAFNDDLVRGELDARAMAAALGRLPAGSIAHLVELDAAGDGPFEWLRADDHSFAPAVMAGGGMVVSMTGGEAASGRAAMRSLVRPLRIDDLHIEGAAALDDELAGQLADDDAALAAGRGLRLRTLLAAGTLRDPLVVRGRIWGRELALPVAADRTLEAALPALVIGGSWADLDDLEQAEVARRGTVVSPATSLLVELGDRPTGHDEMLGSSGSGCGCGGGSFSGRHTSGTGTLGHRSGRRRAPEPDRHALLAGALVASLRACAAVHGPAAMKLTIETTIDEVVDVSVEAGGRAGLATCAAEAAWALALPAAFDQEHAIFRVPFDP